VATLLVEIRAPLDGKRGVVMSQSMWVVLETGDIPDDLIPEAEGFGDGSVIFKRLDELGTLAGSLGLRPLDDFVLDYEESLENAMSEGHEDESVEDIIRGLGSSGPWHDPREAIRTVRGLLRGIEDSSPQMAARFKGASWDLRSFEKELEYAEQQGTRFHFGVEY